MLEIWTPEKKGNGTALFVEKQAGSVDPALWRPGKPTSPGGWRDSATGSDRRDLS